MFQVNNYRKICLFINLAPEDRITNTTRRKCKKAGGCNGILKLLIFQRIFTINVWFKECIKKILLGGCDLGSYCYY